MDIFALHYPKESKLEDSAYYWWYRFMGLLKDYGPAHPLWDDFGDVTLPFWDWWIAIGEDLFSTGALDGVCELFTDDEVAEARSEGAYIVRVDGSCSREFLERMFRDFLDEKKISKTPGRKRFDDTHEFLPARRNFDKTPDARSLKNSFKVLEKWLEKEEKHKKMSLYDIGVAIGTINPQAIILKTDVGEKQDDKKNSMTATVSRYLRWGKSILAGVGEGRFPVM